MLTESEMEEVIKGNRIGVLSLMDGDKPYSIPMEYLYHDKTIFLSTRPKGRKIDCINKNSRVCFTIYESRRVTPKMILEDIPCRSIIVEGTIRPVKEFEVGPGRPLIIHKIEAEKIGTWKCPTKPCRIISGIDAKEILLRHIV